MAVYTEEAHVTRPAGADLSAKQWFIVKLNSSKQVVLSSAATDKHFGIVANVPDSATNSPVDVVLCNADGTFKVTAGGSVAVGDLLTSDANGKAIATTTSGDRVIGMAVTAGASGELVEFAPAGFGVKI
jgi:hypothetical protein